MTSRATLYATLSSLLLGTVSACSFAPDYHRPDVDTPVAFKEVDGWMTAQPADAAPRGKWWTVYGDTQLDTLEDKVGSSNQDLKVALARYEEARAGVRAARAAFFPTINATAYDERDRSSPNFSDLTNGKAYNDYLGETELSYEIDLWGKVRNEVAEAKNLSKASGGDYASIDLSLRAELAEDYFALRADDSEQKVLDDTVVAYGKALELTRNRFKGGAAAELDVDQAQTQYENTRTQAEDLRLKRAQLEHAIAVLTGAAPASFKLEPAPLQAHLPAIGSVLPSALLQRRPDIAAAERRVMAANNQIGVARAAWFPDFTLEGLFGFESIKFSNVASAGSRIWSLGPSMTVPVFDAGRINAMSDQAKFAYDENAASYRKTVLTAFQEVENNLTAIHRLELESKTQASALDAAKRALKQSEDRYTGGIITYLDVVVEQNTELQAQLADIDIEARRVTASIQLIKALGGTWDDRPGPAQPVSDPQPKPIVAKP